MIIFGQFLEGWRKSGALLFILAWVLTSTLFAILGVSVSVTGGLNTDAVLHQGDCTKAKRLNTALHFLINILSTGLLASSNFFMQTLVAPTRKDIDIGHSQFRWLDLAVPSLRNVRFISIPRRILWILLSLTSIPLHLFFNSCVYNTDVSTDYVAVLASESFMHGGNYHDKIGDPVVATRNQYLVDRDLRAVADYMAEEAHAWENLTASDCYSIYTQSIGDQPLRTRRHVVVVLEREDNIDGWDLGPRYGENVTTSIWATYNCYRYVGPDDDRVSSGSGSPFRDADVFLAHPNYPDNYSPYIFYGGRYGPLRTTSCRSEQIPENCRVNFSNRLGLVIVLFALSKCVICTLSLALLWKSRPLVTIGDAIESFMLKPDPSTAGMCTYSYQDFETKYIQGQSSKKRWQGGARKWINKRRRWGSSVSWTVWAVAYTVSLLSWVVGIYLLSEALRPQPLSKAEFGSSPTNYYIDSLSMAENLTGASLIANLPQLCLSIAYLLLNGIYTRMLTTREWSNMCSSYTALRTSIPRGEQKATYFLQIPLIWALPLQGLSVLLHWLVSNSIYLISQETLPSNHIDGQTKTRIAVGYSSPAIIATLAVSAVVICLPIIAAMIPLKPQMTIVGNNSAAVSAACHSLSTHLTSVPQVIDSRIEGGDSDPAFQMESMALGLLQGEQLWESSRKVLMKIKWGSITEAGHNRCMQDDDDEEVEVGHLAFGIQNDGVKDIIEGAWYAGALAERNVSE